MSQSDTLSSCATDRTAEFLRLLGLHEPQLRGFILTLVPHWADAEDIAQEVRIRLWEQFDRYDPNKNFGSWSRTVAYYQILTHREKLSRHGRFLGEEFLHGVAQEVELTADELERRRGLLAECLQKLNDRMRQLLLDYYSGRETTRQIAARVGRSFDAIRQSILRTRNLLAKCVAQNRPAPGDKA